MKLKNNNRLFLKTFAAILLLCIAQVCGAQQKPAAKKKPQQQDMNKLLEEAMQQEGMSKQEQEEMKKMMKDVMPVLQQQNAATADYPDFTSNRSLVPQKDAARLATAKKIVTKEGIGAYASGLYNKLLPKIKAEEAALVKKITGSSSKAGDITNASVLAMLQGHAQASLALSLKALAGAPANDNFVNNTAALLTCYGFPEHAMPLLQYLEKQQPGNSTVLTNIAYAWLGLGETEKAMQYAGNAMAINPGQPEAQLCGGIIEELTGDPIKANEQYSNAQSLAPNPFTQKIRENSKSTASLDWDKIRRSIAIYEYFPNNWISLPKITDDVMAFEENLAWQKAFGEMMEQLDKNIDALTDQSQKELDALSDKGDDAFAKEMAGAALKGQSWISKPAAEVLKVLHAYEAQRQLSYADSMSRLINWKAAMRKNRDEEINKIYKKISDRNGGNCKSFKVKLEEIENSYMRTVNGRMRSFLKDYAEMQRQWLNAYVTWSWYVAGNIKNVIMMQGIQSAGYLAGTYRQVVEMMEAMPQHCAVKTNPVTKTLPVPDMPNFTCPAVVSIPGGTEWKQLTATAAGADPSGMIKKTKEAIPNLLISYGVGSTIAQAAMSPSVKTGNGSITPVPGNSYDKPASILPKQAVPQPDERKAKLAKELMQKMMQADCNKVRNSKDVVREALEKMRKAAEKMESETDLKELLDKLKEERIRDLTSEAIEKYIQAVNDKDPSHYPKNYSELGEILDKIAKHYPDAMKEVEIGMSTYDTYSPQLSVAQQAVTAAQTIHSMQDKLTASKIDLPILNDIRDNGLQPSISSSLQAPVSFGFLKGIF